MAEIFNFQDYKNIKNMQNIEQELEHLQFIKLCYDIQEKVMEENSFTLISKVRIKYFDGSETQASNEDELMEHIVVYLMTTPTNIITIYNARFLPTFSREILDFVFTINYIE
jgi:hypothetical protein